MTTLFKFVLSTQAELGWGTLGRAGSDSSRQTSLNGIVARAIPLHRR
jgi:hypothetical protein